MIESRRKDVECFLGIIKGRFRILKRSNPDHYKKDIDNVFFTSCNQHNILHTFDGVDRLVAGVKWAQSAGNHEP